MDYEIIHIFQFHIPSRRAVLPAGRGNGNQRTDRKMVVKFTVPIVRVIIQPLEQICSGNCPPAPGMPRQCQLPIIYLLMQRIPFFIVICLQLPYIFQQQHCAPIIFIGKPIAGVFIHRYHHIPMGGQIISQIPIAQIRIRNPVMVSMDQEQCRAIGRPFGIPDFPCQGYLCQGIPLIPLLKKTVHPFIFSKPAEVYRLRGKTAFLTGPIGNNPHLVRAILHP